MNEVHIPTVGNQDSVITFNALTQVLDSQYNALLSQDGVLAPYQDDLNGNTGNTPFTDTIGGVWSYNQAGSYDYTKVGAFSNLDRINVTLGENRYNQGIATVVGATRLNDDTIRLFVGLKADFGAVPVGTDALLYIQPISIQIYGESITNARTSFESLLVGLDSNQLLMWTKIVIRLNDTVTEVDGKKWRKTGVFATSSKVINS